MSEYEGSGVSLVVNLRLEGEFRVTFNISSRIYG